MSILNIYAELLSAGGAEFRLQHFKSYRIEQSIEIPADQFEIVMANQNYEVSKHLAIGDPIEFFLENGTKLIYGYIDDIEFNYGIDSNDIRITGRDGMSLLLDNDAEPKTFYKISLKEYLGKVCPKYKINFNTSSTEKFDKIVISPGETEFSVIERLCKDRKLVVYFDSNNVLQCGKLVSSSTPIYTFSNDKPNSIKIKHCNVAMSADIKSDVIVYGGNYEKNKNIKGSHSDKRLPYKKKRIINDSEIETTKDANERAKEEFYQLNKDVLEVSVEVATTQQIPINRAANIFIKKAEVDMNLLIEKVVYSKDISQGNVTSVSFKPMPGIEVRHKNNIIPLLPKL